MAQRVDPYDISMDTHGMIKQKAIENSIEVLDRLYSTGAIERCEYIEELQLIYKHIWEEV